MPGAARTTHTHTHKQDTSSVDPAWLCTSNVLELADLLCYTPLALTFFPLRGRLLAKIVSASRSSSSIVWSSTHVRMERQRSSEAMQPGSKVAKVVYSESSSGRSSPGSSSPGSSSGGERCHLEQEARCPAPSSKPRLRCCGVCSQRVGCSQSSIYMAFDQPFCSIDCREKAVLRALSAPFTRSLTAFDLPPSSSQRLSAALAG